MSSLYPQKMKSVGVAVSQTCRAIIVLIQLKVFCLDIDQVASHLVLAVTSNQLPTHRNKIIIRFYCL